MSSLKIAVTILLIFSSAACARLGNSAGTGSRVTIDPVATTASALTSTQIKDFLEAGAVAGLSEKEKIEAASAQFYALQFGRPGAPRVWQGDSGNSGKVTVGPYVRVNQLDCRDFSHVVTAASETFERSGTACREADGGWKVV